MKCSCASPLREKSSQQVPELCPFCWIILYLYFLWQSGEVCIHVLIL